MKMEVNRFRKWFQTRGRLQILAVLLAIVAWFLVQTAQIIKERASIKVVYEDPPPGLALSKKPLNELKVLLSGSLHRIRNISDEDLVYRIDLSRLKKGLQYVEIDVANVQVSSDIEISNPFPRRVEVFLEDSLSKSLPIEVEIESAPPDQFSVRSIKLEPEFAQVRGPASHVAPLDEVTVKLDLSSRRESFSTSILLEKPHPTIEILESVLVDVEIVELNLERSFENIPVVSMDETVRIKADPPTATVKLRGTKLDFESDLADLKIKIPVEGLRKGNGYRLPGKLDLPNSRLRIVSIEPEAFIVNILK